MKILCLCDQGNNRSVQFAHLLKYWGNDCIPAGIKTNSPETLKMLFEWAELVILTEDLQTQGLLGIIGERADWSKTLLLSVGPDIYPRPFNSELHGLAKQLLEENKTLLKCK